MKRWMVLAALLTTLAATGVVFAETCLSPYIKGLRQPETVLYLWTLRPTGQAPTTSP